MLHTLNIKLFEKLVWQILQYEQWREHIFTIAYPYIIDTTIYSVHSFKLLGVLLCSKEKKKIVFLTLQCVSQSSRWQRVYCVLLYFRLGTPEEGVGSKMASRYYQEMQESFRNNSKSREFPAHSAKVHSVAWSCDGRRLASGSFDKTASVFVLEKDRLVSPANMLILMLAAPLIHDGWMDAR